MHPSARLLVLAAPALLLALAFGGEKPAPGPAEEKPANPFGETRPARPDAVPGKLILSDGKEHRGKLYLTRDKKLELFEDARNEWHKLDLKDLKSVSFAIEKEETVKEWRWKEPGSDVKVETGRTKVDRKYQCTAATNDGKKIAGHVRGTVIYVAPAKEGAREGKAPAREGEAPAEPQRFFLYWNHPGDFDQKPEDLVYVKEIVFGEEAAKEPDDSENLAPSQLEAIEPVAESLIAKLTASNKKYPELGAFDIVLDKKDPRRVGFLYASNFTAPLNKRGIKPTDFSENGTVIAFWCSRQRSAGAKYAVADAPPSATFENLGIELRMGVRASAKPSKGYLDEVGALLAEHRKMLEDADAKAKKPEAPPPSDRSDKSDPSDKSDKPAAPQEKQ